MRLLVILLFVFTVTSSYSQEPVTVISVDKTEKFTNKITGAWSLQDRKCNYDHLIRFKADSTFYTYTGLSGSDNLLKGTWEVKEDSLHLKLMEPEESNLDFEIRIENEARVYLHPAYYSLESYENNNPWVLFRARLD